VLQIANQGVERSIAQSAPLASALNIHRGRATNLAVAETFGLKFEPL
jgi:alanine dehydrogenase